MTQFMPRIVSHEVMFAFLMWLSQSCNPNTIHRNLRYRKRSPIVLEQEHIFGMTNPDHNHNYNLSTQRTPCQIITFLKLGFIICRIVTHSVCFWSLFTECSGNHSLTLSTYQTAIHNPIAILAQSAVSKLHPYGIRTRTGYNGTLIQCVLVSAMVLNSTNQANQNN